MQEDTRRKIWGEQLPRLLRTPVFRDPLDDPGDPMFWAPLIAVHAGLRMEEALQLRCDDIGHEAGVCYFDIRVGPGQSLKTRAATRRVPLHRNLFALGLLNLVALRRRQGEDRLFPHLRRGRDRGSLSSLFTKDFTRYRQAHDVYDRARDFPSFRTGFNVEMINQGVHAEIRKVLMGHVIRDVNLQNYGGDGHPLIQLRRAVELVEVDVTMVRRPFAARPDVLTLADHRSSAGAG